MNDLTRFAEKQGFKVRQKPLEAHDGMLYGSRIAIREGGQEQDYILAHELAHAYLHEGDTINSPLHDLYEKQADRGAKLILDLMDFMGR